MAEGAKQTPIEQPRSRRGDGHVQSLARAFAVLKCFDAESPMLTISDVATKSGLDRAAARRYLLTLQSLAYVGSHDRHFFLRPRVLELGYGYLAAVGIPRLAQPHLDRLAGAAGESCAITVLDQSEVVYVAVANAERALSIRLTVSNRLPAVNTAMGRVLLSGLPQTQVLALLAQEPVAAHTVHTTTDLDDLADGVEEARRNGWAVVDQELELGVRSVAVPVRDFNNDIVAAASLSTPAARTSVKTLRTQMLDKVQGLADAIHGQME